MTSNHLLGPPLSGRKEAQGSGNVVEEVSLMALFLLPFALLVGPVPAGPPGAARDPAPVRATPFPDVPRSHWAYDAVEQLRQAGILRGYPPARAKPRK